jgi:hypothetical protein
MFCFVLLSAVSVRAQEGTGTITGVVTDAATKKPVADAVVTVTSPTLQGEQLMVTDSAGFYRLPNLPPGDYSLRLEKEAFRPYSRAGIALRANTTLRVNALLLPEAVSAEEVVVQARAPTVDVGSSTTGTTISSDFSRRVPVSPPSGKGAGARSFESLAATAPGARADAYGVSLAGTTSPENHYVLDGVTVNNPGTGYAGTALSSEFVQEVHVMTGGYLPEFGRNNGGVLNVVTKSGSNEFHGSVFGFYTPGALEGPRKPIRVAGQTVSASPSLDYIGDVGFDFGGPILRDRLWFYTGFDISRTRFDIRRVYNKNLLDADGAPLLEDDGSPRVAEIPGTERDFVAEAQTLQGLAKLTWSPSNRHRFTAGLYVVRTTSGGDGKFSIDPRNDVSEASPDEFYQSYGALAHQRLQSSIDGSLKWSTDFNDKRVLWDTAIGWHHEQNALLAADGTGPGSTTGLASQWRVDWARNTPGPHPITDFEQFPGSDQCDAPGTQNAVLCPVYTYSTGGPTDLHRQKYDRLQGSSMVTLLLQAAGHHVVKLGASAEVLNYNHVKAYAGGRQTVEESDGSAFTDLWGYGVLLAPDRPVFFNPYEVETRSLVVGGFAQDSWSVLDTVTLNVGLRYDAQFLYNGAGTLGVALPNEWSPRLGAIYDPTGSGRAKVFANYARYYQDVTLEFADVSLTGEPHVLASRNAARCNPLSPAEQQNECQQDATLNPHPWHGSEIPSRKWATFGGIPAAVDPDLKPPSDDELVLGGEYELLPNARLGATYTKRWSNYVVEDMSRDPFAGSFFLGNPGYGIASDFPKAKRSYDAITLFFLKSFADNWLAQVSYTLASLRGNIAGAFRPESKDLLPSHLPDFDLPDFRENIDGALPGDRRHDIKIFGAKDWPISASHTIGTGMSASAHSGEPTSALGGSEVYGSDAIYVTPRGTGPRLPWNYQLDAQLAYRYSLGKERSLVFTMDVFNLLNFQGATDLEETYTSSSVRPASSLAAVQHPDGTPLQASEVNPNYGRATDYQPPRIFRFGVRATF